MSTTTTTPVIAPGAVDCELCGADHDAVVFCHEFGMAVCTGAHRHLHEDRPDGEHGPTADNCTPESVGAVWVETNPTALLPGDVIHVAGTRAIGVVDDIAHERAQSWSGQYGYVVNTPILVCNVNNPGVQSDSLFVSFIAPERTGTNRRGGRWSVQGNNRGTLVVRRVPFGPVADDE